MAMKKVYCKKCGEGLLMAYDPDKIDPELEKSLKACEDTPCSRCVSPAEYSKKLMENRKKHGAPKK